MKWICRMFCFFFPFLLYGQSPGFLSLQVPHTITATGMGEHGAASRNVFDTFQYNPANIVYSRGCEVTLTKNPWRIFGMGIPLTCFSVVAPFQDLGTFGLSYTFHNYGTVYMVDASTGTTRTMDFIERSLALTYGTKVSDEFSVGAQIRYAWSPTFRTSANKYYDQGMLSIGTSYTPKSLEQRVTLGFSCMNFGPAVEGDPLPATMALGIEADVVSNEYVCVTSAGSVTKPFDQRNRRTGRAPSSFELLFTDWNDFPEDATVHFGTSIRWNALGITEHFSMFQEMYFGYFSTGPKSISESFYTHGMRVGLRVHQVELAAGYAGRWFNNNEGRYIIFHYPWELYQN